MPAIATIHVVKVFTNEAAIPLQAPFHTRARPSALTVKQLNALITVTIAAMQTMWTSRAEMLVQAWKRFARHLKRNSKKITKTIDRVEILW